MKKILTKIFNTVAVFMGMGFLLLIAWEESTYVDKIWIESKSDKLAYGYITGESYEFFWCPSDIESGHYVQVKGFSIPPLGIYRSIERVDIREN